VDGPPVPPVILNLFSHERDGPASAIALVTMLATGLTAAAGWSVYRLSLRRRPAMAQSA
jgi:hypothetical protein